MKLIMVDDEGNAIELGQMEGDYTTARMLDIFGGCIHLQRKKAQTYGNAYRSQGYMGNVGRVLSKASRLKKMVWTDVQIESREETVMDTLLDMINLICFTIINRSDRNKWGEEL